MAAQHATDTSSANAERQHQHAVKPSRWNDDSDGNTMPLLRGILRLQPFAIGACLWNRDRNHSHLCRHWFLGSGTKQCGGKSGLPACLSIHSELTALQCDIERGNPSYSLADTLRSFITQSVKISYMKILCFSIPCTLACHDILPLSSHLCRGSMYTLCSCKSRRHSLHVKWEITSIRSGELCSVGT